MYHFWMIMLPYYQINKILTFKRIICLFVNSNTCNSKNYSTEIIFVPIKNKFLNIKILHAWSLFLSCYFKKPDKVWRYIVLMYYQGINCSVSVLRSVRFKKSTPILAKEHNYFNKFLVYVWKLGCRLHIEVYYSKIGFSDTHYQI